jgi:hypothetical protein
VKLVLPLVAAAALLAGCGSSDTTTVVNNTTTTTVVEESSSSTTSTAEPATASSTTTPATSTEDSGSTQNLSSFQSPSGNIGCIMSADSVRCDIAEKQWTADRPADCPKQVDYGQGLELPANGYARVVCAGDTVLDPSAPTLAYGDSTRAGSIVCVSAEAGMDCANDSGGHFRIARESYDLG